MFHTLVVNVLILIDWRDRTEEILRRTLLRARNWNLRESYYLVGYRLMNVWRIEERMNNV